jgi:drug/metabolite transporter (DMT)-like permease
MLMACGCVSGTLLCLAVLPLTGDSLLPPAEAGIRGWWPLFAIAIVSHFLGQGSIAYGFAHLPASFSSVTLLVQPLVAAVASWVLLGEQLGLLAMVGGVTVLLGIFFARRGSTPEKKTGILSAGELNQR